MDLSSRFVCGSKLVGRSEKGDHAIMKSVLLFVLAAASCAFAQDQEKRDVVYQTTGQVAVGAAAFEKVSAPVLGAPYSATITNESIQTLADGNRIVQTSTGNTARDSQGRTRQDTVLPALGNLSAGNAPHLVFIHDPVSQASYTLNLTDKTAHKMPALPPLAGGAAGVAGATFAVRIADGKEGALPPPDMPVTIAAAPASGAFLERHLSTEEHGELTTEDLGSQTMEGVPVKGVRRTRTIPAGQIGNDRPITIITEVWTSPDLKTVVYSKRSDPRIGEQTFRLTNIVRTEPDATLFTVPADFKIVDDPQPIVYRNKQ
jgi:hypothetical protein